MILSLKSDHNISSSLLEDEKINPDEEEGNWLDSVFEEGEKWLGDLDLGGGCSFGLFPNLG